MSKKAKLIARLLSKPSDFTFDETIRLLGYFGYSSVTTGKTSGSRVTFANSDNDYIRLHKPHPRNNLLSYQIDDLVEALKVRGLI
ncbi:MAG: type II toxin-antitoxin system HicA family toxin [Clostridiales Family XIII bacterium]|nr:type II toxin-antitoxin system HicA family toxin [Clostridiales Family XIII bacterium]